MNLTEIVTRAARLLQDTDYRRWELQELYAYVEDAQQEWLRLTEYPQVQADVPVVLGESSIAVPNNISAVKNVRLQGMQMKMQTSLGLDQYYAAEHVASGMEAWQTLTGTPLYIVADERSTKQLRIVPYPTEIHHLQTLVSAAAASNPIDSNGLLAFVVDADGDETGELVELSAGADTGWTWTVEGVIDSTNTLRAGDGSYDPNATSVLPAMYAEALVYGALERAYYKENELRNLNKSQLWRSKFLQFAQDCQRREGLNGLSNNTGVNRQFMSLPFPRKTRYRSSGPLWNPQTLVPPST